jgi:hypothetical protein
MQKDSQPPMDGKITERRRPTLPTKNVIIVPLRVATTLHISMVAIHPAMANMKDI